jgi:hypothetical protein
MYEGRTGMSAPQTISSLSAKVFLILLSCFDVTAHLKKKGRVCPRPLRSFCQSANRRLRYCFGVEGAAGFVAGFGFGVVLPAGGAGTPDCAL